MTKNPISQWLKEMTVIDCYLPTYHLQDVRHCCLLHVSTCTVCTCTDYVWCANMVSEINEGADRYMPCGEIMQRCDHKGSAVSS